MRFQEIFCSKEDRFSLGTDLHTGDRYLSIPVSNQIVDYIEYYRLTEGLYQMFYQDLGKAKEFAEKCGRRELDDLLIFKPGSDRGVY